MFPCRAPRKAESIRDESLINLIMGVPENQSSQNSNKRQRSEESDGSSDSDTRQPIAQVTSQSALNVPRFLVVQSADPDIVMSGLCLHFMGLVFLLYYKCCKHRACYDCGKRLADFCDDEKVVTSKPMVGGVASTSLVTNLEGDLPQSRIWK